MPRLLERGADRIAAILHYGSHLLGMAGADSEPDFFVVLRHPHFALDGGWRDALLGRALPPSLYHPLFLIDGINRRAKLCVVSGRQLQEETSAQAHDLYHLGRFSKPLALLYARDRAARRLVVEARASALEVLAPLALARIPRRFSLDEFLAALLGLSYLSEIRIAEPGKIERLLASHHRSLTAEGRCLLDVLAAQRLVDIGASTHTHYAAADSRPRLEEWLIRSRRRALLRWPKYLITFEGWLDYLVAKLERHTGERLALSRRERRHPLLLAWPRLLQLHRRGLVR